MKRYLAEQRLSLLDVYQERFECLEDAEGLKMLAEIARDPL